MEALQTIRYYVDEAILELQHTGQSLNKLNALLSLSKAMHNLTYEIALAGARRINKIFEKESFSKCCERPQLSFIMAGGEVDENNDYDYESFRLKCDNCGASTGECDTPEQAYKLWEQG